ncbi:MAG TPA: hypothetical protein GXZ30_12115 [Propionibacterium sp.]|nr:hypothetical protein [Propionibacterium sp.]
MKVSTLERVGVVVRDLDAAMSQYAKFLGIDSWQVYDADADEVSDLVSRGRRTTGTYRSAVGSTSVGEGLNPLDRPLVPITFELVQPTGGETPFNEYLLTKGPGIAWLTVRLADDSPGRDDVPGALAEHGVELAARWTAGGVPRLFWDTRELLGGFLIEVVTEALPARGETRTIDGAGLRDGEAPLPTQGIHHFGVVVDDVMKLTRNYHDLFGIDVFPISSWRAEYGRLDAPQYWGEPVEHGYFTAVGLCDDFGFEIIQCTYGDSHYNRDFLDHRGPGIHHLFPFITKDQDDWTEKVRGMRELGATLCMGSDLRGGAGEFGYFDTQDELGFVIEGVVRRTAPDPALPGPEFVVDFREEADRG